MSRFKEKRYEINKSYLNYENRRCKKDIGIMKIKVIRQKREEIETEYEYPIYLYFQDEYLYDEIIKIDEKYTITVKNSWDGTHIIKNRTSSINEFDESDLATEEEFNKYFNSALDYIK